MANKAISELPQAQNVNNQDLFVLEQSGIAKKLTAETFITEQGIIDALAEALDGHGGIQSVTLSSVSGRIRTYLITFTDGTSTTFQVLDGTSIDRIVKTSTAGLTDTYTVFMSDGTTTFFTVTNGADGTVSEAMLNDALKDKAPAVTETTESSAIANFPDGADDMPLHNILAEINPVQDLNGYDNPWPAGGGKNKLKITANTSTHNGVTMTVNRDTYGNVFSVSLNGTATAMYDFQLFDVTTESFVLDNATYYLLPTPNNVKLYITISNNGANRYIDALSAGTKSFTIADGDVIVAAFIRVESGATLNNLVVYPEIASENTSTFTPYSNICPISGWTGCNVTRTGINVWDEEWENGFYSRETGKKAGNSDTTYFRSKNYIPCVPNTSYYFKAPSVHASNNTYFAVLFYGVDKSYISAINSGIGNTVRTTPQNAHFMTLYIEVGTSGATYQNDISVNYPSTDTDYHSGTDNATLTVDWTTEAGTVYGGTIDIATGLLTVEWTKYIITTDILSGTIAKEGNLWRVVLNRSLYGDNNDYKMGFCDRYTFRTGYVMVNTYNNSIAFNYSAGNQILIHDDSITTADELRASISNQSIECVYPIATPQTYQLTPQEVKTLLGTNNVWTDIGNVSVTYPADTKMFIEKLTMPTEDDMTANQAIASGTFFMVGQKLYLSIASIASGAQIIEGTNARQLSLADALNTLSS